MLKAAIIYVPGTGGNFLRRALSLGKDLMAETAYESIDVEQKFQLFNNWNPINWTSSEQLHRPAYRHTDQEFYHFEQSKLLLIDAWHPVDFLQHDRQESAWPTGKWPNLIFINVNDSNREFIERNQKTKAYRVDWVTETRDLDLLKQQYKDKSIEIDFDDLCNQQQFLVQVNRISSKLYLQLDMDLVSQLWESWHTASETVWHK